MPDITTAELQTAIAQLGRVMVRTDEGEASGVILYPNHVAGNLIGAITGREERGPCRECPHREREHYEIGSKDGPCQACGCRHYRAPLPASMLAPVDFDDEPEGGGEAIHPLDRAGGEADAELAAIATAVAHLECLDGLAQRRVLRYLADRYGIED